MSATTSSCSGQKTQLGIGKIGGRGARRTFFDAILLGPASFALGGSDSLNTLVKMVLRLGADLGLFALCNAPRQSILKQKSVISFPHSTHPPRKTASRIIKAEKESLASNDSTGGGIPQLTFFKLLLGVHGLLLFLLFFFLFFLLLLLLLCGLFYLCLLRGLR